MVAVILSKVVMAFGIQAMNIGRFQATACLLLPCTATAYWYTPVMRLWDIDKIVTVLPTGNFMLAAKNMLDTVNQEHT
jgi:hypothetical protein